MDFDLTYQTKLCLKFNALTVYFCPNSNFFTNWLGRGCHTP